MANHNSLPEFDLKNYNPEWLHHSGIKLELIERYHIIPLNRDEHSLRIGITDTTNHSVISALAFHTGLHIQPVLVAEAALTKLINTLCRPNILYSQLETALSKLAQQNSSSEPIQTEASEDPVIAFVDQLINNAIEKKISDIHIEPCENQSRIRFRRNGLLYEAATIPSHLASQMTMRLKVMAHLNTTEKRLPLDGRLQLHNTHKMDIRISTCPTLYGEKIVLRLLHGAHSDLHIDSLGMTNSQKDLFLKKLSQPQGLILVTGPTGSGKTMTLYAALKHLNHVEKNISTIEDPVEIELPGINQTNINPKIGLDFFNTLRALLRQDPDIIMLGEIRDKETATIALQASQTGHLVLSTLHTTNAANTLSRLHAMGIASHYLNHSISLIIAQRLIRISCQQCKQLGCDQCHQGYVGRLGIFELFAPESPNKKYKTLWEIGLEQVQQGITTNSEIMRVLGK